MTDAGDGAGVGRPQGPVLAIETSWRVGSVAIALGGVVLARRYLTDRSDHAARLIPAIEEVLGAAGLGRRDLEGVVVGAGPGSFTGVRVAASTAKGIARGLEVPLFPSSSLAAAACSIEVLRDESTLPDGLYYERDSPPGPIQALAEGQREVRYVLFDARGGRIYGACYDVGSTDAVEAIAHHGGTIIDVLNRRPPLGTAFTGDGAWAHAALIRGAGYPLLPAPGGVPTADGLLRCATWEPADIKSWEPDYVRDWQPGPR